MDMSFLRDTIDGVLDQAVEAAHGLIETAQQVLDEVDSQLDEWADELRESGDAESVEPSAQDMFDYLVQNSAGRENASYNSARSFLLSDYGNDALVGLYESKKQEQDSPLNFDFGNIKWPNDDWWAGKD